MSTPPPYGQPGYPRCRLRPARLRHRRRPQVQDDRRTAGLLPGSLGIHNFYRGQKGRGFGHLALLIISIIAFIMAGVSLASNLDAYGNVSDSGVVGLGIGGFVGYLMVLADGIWAFVEFIMILVSKDGTLQ